jgi:large subunit ribosomal protein L24
MKLRKGDQVIVNTGKDRSKTGKIISISKKSGKVIVEGINIYKKHVKPSNKYPQGGIVDKNMPLDESNVSVICPGCKKVTRVKVTGTGKDKSRICTKCKESINATA